MWLSLLCVEALAKDVLKARPKATRETVERFLTRCMVGTYGKDNFGGSSVRFNTVSSFLVKCAKALCSPKQASDKELYEALAGFEMRMREKLQGTMKTWPAVVSYEFFPDVKKAAPDTAGSEKAGELAAPILKFAEDGSLVENHAAKFQKMGGEMGKPVHLKRKWSDFAKNDEGIVVEVSKTGVQVKFTDKKESTTVPVGVLVIGPAPKKSKAEEQKEKAAEEAAAAAAAEAEIQGLPYKLASSRQSELVKKSIAEAALYRLLVSCGSGPAAIRLSKGSGGSHVCTVAQDFAPGELVLVPFSDNILLKAPADKDYAIKILVELGDEKSVFWVQAPQTDDGNLTLDPPILPAKNPFWLLMSGSKQKQGQQVVQLQWKLITVEMPWMLSVGSNNQKTLKAAQSRMTFKVTYATLTNATPLAKGQVLVAAAQGEKPKVNMPKY